MDVVKLKLDTACNFLNMDLFGLVYQEEIIKAVNHEAKMAGKTVDDYLCSRFNIMEENAHNKRLYMARVFLDKLSTLSIAI